MEARLSFVTLAVADVGRARAFYEALGLVASPRSNDGVAFFQLSQGLVLALFGRAHLAEDAGRAEELDAGRGVSVALAHNVRTRAEVAELLARAQAAGGRITRPPSDTPWGVWRGYFADPDGHAWEVAHNPKMTWDDRGGVWLDPPGTAGGAD